MTKWLHSPQGGLENFGDYRTAWHNPSGGNLAPSEDHGEMRSPYPAELIQQESRGLHTDSGMRYEPTRPTIPRSSPSYHPSNTGVSAHPLPDRIAHGGVMQAKPQSASFFHSRYCSLIV